MVISNRKKKKFGYFKEKWEDFKDNYRWMGWRALVPKFFRTVYIWCKDVIFPHNVIHIKTLDRSYQETDTLMFHGMFQLLVDFVEGQWIGSKYFGKTFNLMEENQRMIDEGYDEEFRRGSLDSLESQNKDTKEIWDLYNWWKFERNKRVAPEFYDKDYDPFVFNPILDEKGEETSFSTLDKNKSDPAKAEAWEKHWAEWKAWDEKCDKEDEDMFFRLIHIRKKLWT
jgi:hypothetical protein